jgi:hypothetical protein
MEFISLRRYLDYQDNRIRGLRLLFSYLADLEIENLDGRFKSLSRGPTLLFSAPSSVHRNRREISLARSQPAVKQPQNEPSLDSLKAYKNSTTSPVFLSCRNPQLLFSSLSAPLGPGPQHLSIPWSGFRAHNQFKMPPIGDDTVQTLQDLVNKLESRVKQLEDKLTHAQAGTKHVPAEGVRMILMGPPGAGVPPGSSPPSYKCGRSSG